MFFSSLCCQPMLMIARKTCSRGKRKEKASETALSSKGEVYARVECERYQREHSVTSDKNVSSWAKRTLSERVLHPLIPLTFVHRWSVRWALKAISLLLKYLMFCITMVADVGSCFLRESHRQAITQRSIRSTDEIFCSQVSRTAAPGLCTTNRVPVA